MSLTNNFLKSLDIQIKKISNKYRSIDWGGCGIFSYYLSEKLNSESIHNEIVYIPEKETPKNAYRCDIKFQHILVKVGDYIIDNHGYREINDYEYFNEILPLDRTKLKNMLEDKKLWNDRFPFYDWNWLADEILNISLKD